MTEFEVPSTPFCQEIPRILFFGLIGTTYFFLSPLILPFLLVYFCLGYVIYRNQLLNVYEAKYETGGKFWPIVHSSTIFSLVLMHIIAVSIHKQRDIVPLDVNEDTDDSSDEDDVQPVFDLKGVDDDEDEDEEDEDTEDKEEDKGLIAKMVGQNKYLKAKFGAVDDEMADDDKDKDEEDKRVTWGSRKQVYRDADNVEFEVRSVVVVCHLQTPG